MSSVISAAHPSHIRVARPEDRHAITEVARAAGLFPPEELTEVNATLDAFLTGETQGDRWLVYDTADGVAAIAFFAPERMTEGTWNLYFLAVHPEHQSQGLGAALVLRVEHDLREAGARVLLIETSGVPGFAAQRSFYARLGYHEEGRIREFYAPGDDKIIYWKHMQRTSPQLPADEPQT